jgi:hypothetical protein
MWVGHVVARAEPGHRPRFRRLTAIGTGGYPVPQGQHSRRSEDLKSDACGRRTARTAAVEAAAQKQKHDG